jgi:hypothetical protein
MIKSKICPLGRTVYQFVQDQLSPDEPIASVEIE